MIVQVLVLLSIGIFIGISQSAGIGGGIIINVLLILGLGYNTKDSVFMSYIFLIGGALASILTSLKKKTPSGKPVIDYDLIMITLPMIMSGAILGTILNNFISQLVISILFVVLMLYMAYITCQKCTDTAPSPSNKKYQETQTDQQIVTQKENERLKTILDEQKNILPFSKIKIIGQIYLYTVIILLIKGNIFDSLVYLPKCSVWSWILSVLHLIISAFYSKLIVDRKMKIQNQKENLGFVFRDKNDKMSYQKMKQGIFNGFTAGFIGSCIGIGGGMILLPLWFKAGIDKNIATSSTGPLILFSSSVSFFISALSQKYSSIPLILTFFTIGFIGSYLIKNFILYLIQKYKFKHLVISLLLFVIILSIASFVPLQINKYNQNREDFMMFGALC